MDGGREKRPKKVLISKHGTYDPRKVREMERNKTYSIKKRYQKLKKRFLVDEGPESFNDADNDQMPTGEEISHRPLQHKVGRSGKAQEPKQEKREPDGKSTRSKKRKEMLKKTRTGQPVMKYRIEKMLDKIQKI